MLHDAKDSLSKEIESRLIDLGKVTVLTHADMVEALSEEQWETLLSKASVSWREGRGNSTVVDVCSLIKTVQTDHQSLKGFLKNNIAENDDERKLLGLARHMLGVWLPSKNMKDLKQVSTDLKQVKPHYLNNIEKGQAGAKTKGKVEEEDEEELDEEAIVALRERRLVDVGRSRKKSDEAMPKIQLFKRTRDVFIRFEDLPSDLEPCPAVIKNKNLWDLNDIQRFEFMLGFLLQKQENLKAGIQKGFIELDELNETEAELKSVQETSILKSKKLIGMTITGASINARMVQSLRPRIVIVEEAGEVLEPDLLAALTPGLQHLILIGDHRQLRPSVDTYKLRTKYKFDLSMMERLINNKFPYSTLNVQNRMRPEFSKLLLDIYPGLQDNLARVRKEPPVDMYCKIHVFLEPFFS